MHIYLVQLNYLSTPTLLYSTLQLPVSMSSDQVKQVTTEQRQAANDAVQKMLKQMQCERDAVKNDKTGIKTLEVASRQLQQLTSAAKAESDDTSSVTTTASTDSEGNSLTNPPDSDDDKTKDKDKDKAKAKSVWENFREAVKEISKFSDNFLAALKNAPISDKTRKDIGDKLISYKKLLEKTKNELQQQRQKAQKLSNTFDNLIFFLLPDTKIVKESLEQFTTSEEKQNEIRRWASQNKDEYIRQTKVLGDAMKDTSGQEAIDALQTEWQKMSDDLQSIMDQVKKEMDTFKKKMAIIIGVAVVVAAVLVGIAAFFSGGTALAALTPLIGSYGAMAVGFLGGAAILGAAVFGVILMAEPEILQVIEKSKNETTNAVNEGLQKIAEQASRVETMLQFIYNDWVEISGAVAPGEAGTMSAFGPNVKALADSLKKTKESIDQLVEDIKETEDVVDSELGAYTEKIYKPLLDLYQ